MKRSEFIRSLSLGSSAVMALYCMGTLTSCTKEEPMPSSSSSTTTGSGGKIDFTIDLSLSANSALLTNGGFLYFDNIIIVRSMTGSFIALSKVCTHQGTTVEYKVATDDIYCSNHGSRYELTGKVKQSPAQAPLTQYKTTVLSSLKVRIFEA
jgi:cytochrome b6-f complex iron-sulfur subunit